jgi:hypothetical protein
MNDSHLKLMNIVYEQIKFFLAHHSRRLKVSYKYQRGMLQRPSSVVMCQQLSSPLTLLGRFTSNLVCIILVTVTLEFAHVIPIGPF